MKERKNIKNVKQPIDLWRIFERFDGRRGG
jgi:hypothetical protein